MLVKAYWNDLENLVIEIPSSEGHHIVEFDADVIQDATEKNPATGQMPDVSPNTQFKKPLGEMSVKDQELHYAKTQSAVGVVDEREINPITRDRQPIPAEYTQHPLDEDEDIDLSQPEDEEEEEETGDQTSGLASAQHEPALTAKTDVLSNTETSGQKPNQKSFQQTQAQNKKK